MSIHALINFRRQFSSVLARLRRGWSGLRKVFRIGTVSYHWPMSAHASQAFSIASCTDSEDLPGRRLLTSQRFATGWHAGWVSLRSECLLHTYFQTNHCLSFVWIVFP